MWLGVAVAVLALAVSAWWVFGKSSSPSPSKASSSSNSGRSSGGGVAAAQHRVSASVTVAAPQGVIEPYLREAARMRLWMKELQDVQNVPGSPNGEMLLVVGAHRAVVRVTPGKPSAPGRIALTYACAGNFTEEGEFSFVAAKPATTVVHYESTVSYGARVAPKDCADLVEKAALLMQAQLQLLKGVVEQDASN